MPTIPTSSFVFTESELGVILICCEPVCPISVVFPKKEAVAPPVTTKNPFLKLLNNLH